MLVRERQSLGFYVSGHPLERYLRGPAALQKLEAHNSVDLAAMSDWSVVKVAGMVEGYREKILRDNGGKIAFFELEDLTGRVNVKVRGKEIDQYAELLTRGEPVLVTGKVSFPRRDEDAASEEEQEANREPTLFLNDVRALSEVVAQDTSHLVLRLSEARTKLSDLQKMKALFAERRGACPVTLFLALEGGAEAVLSLKDTRVEVGDALLAGLERVFGEQVAELR